MQNLKFLDVPAQLGKCFGSIEPTDDGRFVASIRFEPSGGTEARLSSGTDVVLVLDASFSMFAGAYRNGRVLELVDGMIKFMSPYDDDGIDVYLHSLRAEPFRHLGAFSDPNDVTPELGPFMEVRSAMQLMGQRTVCAPVIHDIVRRLKVEKGSDRVFIEIVTDGVFDDQDEVEAAIVEYGNRFNSTEAPFGIRFHFTGVGAQGAKGLEFLDQLDNELSEKHPGFIDCVQHSAASTVEQNIQTIIAELQQTVRLNAENALLAISNGGTPPQNICDAYTKEWIEGGEVAWEGGLPVMVSVHAMFEASPKELQVSLQYLDGESGEFTEFTFRAVPG